jgi:single-strand DNA-binding protein
MINKVILIGNLGRDPEIRHLEGGVSVGKFSLATNESYMDKKGEWQNLTEWHEVVVWRGLAERAEKSLKKGMQVFIEGKIRTRKWQDNEGKDRYMTEIVANTLKILEKRDRDESTNYASSFPTREEPGAIDETSSSRSTEDKIDDLPF